MTVVVNWLYDNYDTPIKQAIQHIQEGAGPGVPAEFCMEHGGF